MADQIDIEILEYKIADIQTKIANFQKYHISELKIQNLQILLLEYQNNLTKLLSS